MKLTKKIVALAMVAALASSATAFAAPASKYDSLMTTAQSLYDQGLYYEANYALAQATEEMGYVTPQIQVLQTAVNFKIDVLETLPPTVVVPQAFCYVEQLMASGLYYEALDMLDQARNIYAADFAAVAEFRNKADMLEIECNQALADYEMDYVESMLANGLIYEAKAEYDTIPVAHMTKDQKERYEKVITPKVAYALQHVIMSVESAESVLYEDTNFLKLIQYDPDMVVVTQPVYNGYELVGFEAAVYASNSNARDNGSALSYYFISTDGTVTTMSGSILTYEYDDITMPHYDWQNDVK